MGKTLSDAWSRCFLGWHFLTFLSLWRGCLWPAAYWAGTFWAGAFLSAVTTFFAGTFTAAVAAATLAEGAFFGRKFQESCFFCSFLTSNLLILFLIFLAFLIFNNQKLSSWLSFLRLSSSWPILWLCILYWYLSSARLVRHTYDWHRVGPWSQWTVCSWEAKPDSLPECRVHQPKAFSDIYNLNHLSCMKSKGD